MKNKIKILHIIKTLSLGGAEVNLLNLLRALDQDKFELHVAYSYGGELEPKFKEAGIKLCKYAERDHWRRGAIIGANAVVTKDVPANAIVAGNPA